MNKIIFRNIILQCYIYGDKGIDELPVLLKGREYWETSRPKIDAEYIIKKWAKVYHCLLYTSDAADD